MSVVGSLIVYLSLAAVPVVVTPLDGSPVTGEFVSATPETFTIESETQTHAVPTREILSVKVVSPAGTKPPEQPTAELRLIDGSRLHFTSLKTSRQSLTLQHADLGELKFSMPQAASIRYGELHGEFTDAWNILLSKERKQDLLVLKKNEVLDHLDGVISSVDDESIVFLLDGEEVTIPREKVFGIIYFRKPSAVPKGVCQVRLNGHDELLVKQLQAELDHVSVVMNSGTTIQLPWTTISELDYSQGKVIYLSSLDPRDVKYTPFFDITWEYTRDRNFDGQKLQLGNTVYERGLCLHSKTAITYRIGKDFRRFRATIGIDRSVSPLGHVKLKISGDGKSLFDGDVRGEDGPVPLDLDVSAVRDLEIVVDFGEDLDIADHLDLAEARVIK
ncbi:MAG: NPCBM/NEW2 domain-containing protein [Planctomycetaceae bacterium]